MRISYNQDLSHRNTFGMKVKCACFVEYSSFEDLDGLFSDARLASELPLPFFHIGGGSNLLFTGDFEGTVFHSKIDFMSFKKEGTVVSARLGAGVLWDDVCAACAERGYWGVENLSLIPGEAGAAAVQNIGAYGVEIKDVLDYVECYDTMEGVKRLLSCSECGYGYRESRFKAEFKGRYVVTAVGLRLSEEYSPRLDYGNLREALEKRYGAGEKLTPMQVREEVMAVRRTKLPDPADVGSAGSFFRNPVVSSLTYAAIAEKAVQEGLGDVPHFEESGGGVKIPAAWLIEKCGWKGVRLGNAAVYEGHPLVLVNATGEAEPWEVLELEKRIVAGVNEKFGIVLLPEVEHI